MQRGGVVVEVDDIFRDYPFNRFPIDVPREERIRNGGRRSSQLTRDNHFLVIATSNKG